jgi:hypothetical protein
MIVRTAASTSARSGLPSWCKFQTGSKARALDTFLWPTPNGAAFCRWRLQDDFLGDRRSVGRKSKPLHHCLGQALAAPTSEGKRIRQYRPNFAFEPIANKLTRTVQPGFDGFRLDIKKFRGFLDAHSLDHTRDEDQTEGFRQIVGRLLDKMD